MNNKVSPKLIVAAILISGFLYSPTIAKEKEKKPEGPPLWGDYSHGRPTCVKGIHLTSWYAGSKKGRAKFEKLFAETELNTAVIDVKEVEGDVYLYDVLLDDEIDMYVPAISKPKAYLEYLKDRGIYTIARIVVFNDIRLAKERPDWMVKTATPVPKALELGFQEDIWVDDMGRPWADPYNEDVWDYNIDVAIRAIELGFQGVQFDYIRFPSDGFTKWCRYSKPHTSTGSIAALAGFLERAHNRLKPMGAEISIDTFGLAGSNAGGMGIGQKLTHLLDYIDVLSPMMYPSHYAPMEYGIEDPNSAPYETVSRSAQDTLEMLKDTGVELRPWLQDFSLGVRYTEEHVRAQIEALRDLGVDEWMLWNPSCRYTKKALLP
jgi:hypothetical protein